MPHTERFRERIGAIFLPEADAVQVMDQPAPVPDVTLPSPGPGVPGPASGAPLGRTELFPVQTCTTSLKQGCYTVAFTPFGTSIFGTRYRGTLRVEQLASGLRFSGDLYRYRLLDWITAQAPDLQEANFLGAYKVQADEAADTGGTIPIYGRADYHSYLRGTGAQLSSVVPKGAPCTFSLDVEEFVYNHPATGFSGSFNQTATRTLRFVLAQALPDFYLGIVFSGATAIGLGSIRWISSSYRRANLQVFTLQGAVTPPADVGGTTFASIFADVGWELAVSDGGTINLPATLPNVDINDCWSEADLHTLMASVPSYNPGSLDSAWNVHLVAVPARLGCSRGVMFDSSIGADPNEVPREGAATFCDDGYPAGEVLDGVGGSHYDLVADQMQRNVPRAFLRSATHEVGHAFNQIHQNFELGIDNSIMTPTPGVARVLGTAGIFPDHINLAFNDQVKRHLRHLPDPAVRPGAMDFFGSAIAAPEAADVAWLDMLELALTLSSDRVVLGEPVTLTWTLTNRATAAVPAPEELAVESLVARVSVTDPSGRITFMRPANILSCPRIVIVPLEPGASVSGSTTLFWGRDGFAFESPGRHVVEVIVLWSLAGVPTAVAGESDVFVAHPTSDEDNEVAAQLLHPDVGRAVAVGNIAPFEGALARIRRSGEAASTHPANAALRRIGLEPEPERPRRGQRPQRGRRRRDG
jgi:hypothetical protein